MTRAFDRLDNMGSKAVPGDVVCSILRIIFHVTDKLEVCQSPCMPSFVPSRIVAGGKEVRMYDFIHVFLMHAGVRRANGKQSKPTVIQPGSNATCHSPCLKKHRANNRDSSASFCFEIPDRCAGSLDSIWRSRARFVENSRRNLRLSSRALLAHIYFN